MKILSNIIKKTNLYFFGVERISFSDAVIFYGVFAVGCFGALISITVNHLN
jgi:hypothetical protein